MPIYGPAGSFLPDGVSGCGFPGFLLPLFAKSKPPDFYDETSIPKPRSRPVACAGLLHGASGARRRILLYCRRRFGRRGRRACLGLLAQLVVPHRRAAVRHVVGIFPASGAGAHARLFRPAFRARGGAVSGVVRALRNLPVPDGTDRCRRSVARRLPHPGQFRRRDRTPLVRLHAAGTLPVRPGCLAVDRDGFAPRHGGLSRALGLYFMHPLCSPRFPGAARRMFLERHADALLFFGIPRLHGAGRLPAPLPRRAARMA